MDLNLPANLHATRDLLMRSLVVHPEQAPVIPDGLASDLAARFAARVTTAAVVAPVSWLEKVRGFLGAPAFGAAAAAVLILGVAVPMLSGPTDTFRGDLPVAQADAVRIIFTGDRPEIRAAVEASALFERSALGTMDNRAAATQAGPKVIVDLTASTITAIDRDGAVLYRAAVPTAPGQAAEAIALAVSSF